MNATYRDNGWSAKRLAGTTPALAALAVPTDEVRQLELMT